MANTELHRRLEDLQKQLEQKTKECEKAKADSASATIVREKQNLLIQRLQERSAELVAQAN